jgi:hypothetical protein
MNAVTCIGHLPLSLQPTHSLAAVTASNQAALIVLENNACR